MDADAQRGAIYKHDASICLIGMRGVGKTTLGLIASTSLRRSFIDADAVFQKLNGPISSYVTAHGWDAFRDAEMAILRKLLEEHPKDYVIACGGGVVERETNRELLRQFKEKGGPIVHVVRDKEETIKYLVDEVARPSWGEEIRHVWSRRTPHFESLATHTIVSLTASPPPASPQFLMKHVETAFVRLLRSIFGLASSHVPLVPGIIPSPVAGPSSGEYGGYGACEREMGRGAKGPRTSFVAFNFPDLRIISGETIRRATEGVDVIELRVDTLVQSRPDTPPESRRGSPNDHAPSRAPPGPPSPHYVALCFGHLRRCSPLPIMYTVRTKTQGGAYPDPYGDDSALLDEYVALVELGFKLGAEYVDVELSLPDEVFMRLLALRGAATQCLATDHDREGKWSWDSQQVMDKYLRAARLGADVVKFVNFPTSFNSNLELLKFRQRVSAIDVGRPLPLLAINLGKGGQLSRFLNPVLTPVTHPLLPGVAAPGQLTYAQTQQALFLSGLILEKTFFVPSSAVAESFARETKRLGLPYKFVVEDRAEMRDAEADFGGAFLAARAVPTSSISPRDDLLPPASHSGWADLVVPASNEPDSYDVPPTSLGFFKHTNVRVLALAEVLSQNLSPINAVGIHTSALLVGLNSKERKEVTEALTIVGARWVFLLGCEDDGEDAENLLRLQSPLQPPATLTSMPPSRAGTPIPYPQRPILTTARLDSFSSPVLYSRRPPTIMIASSAALAFPDTLFASPTGGVALDLSAGKGMLREAVRGREGRPQREGWQLIGPKEVEVEGEKQAFRALTGRRLS